ncbi:hypothetical protein [Paenibacillus sp. FSL R7-0272]|uniref:hypothetical protein n=1 Tax=Paenibacillus sp. FSL R7-0272 TaxID=2921679 RepID=UPI0030ECF37B
MRVCHPISTAKSGEWKEIGGQGEHQGPAARERPQCLSTATGRVDPAKRSTPQVIEPTKGSKPDVY